MNDVLNKIIEQDYSSISNKIQNSLKRKLEEIKSNGVIFGLSGGVDSVVTAYLCANSIKMVIMHLMTCAHIRIIL